MKRRVAKCIAAFLTACIVCSAVPVYAAQADVSIENNLTTGWYGTVEENNRSYVQENGKVLTGIQEIDGKMYFFDDDGILQTGWQEIEGNNYFFSEETGERLENIQLKIGDKIYAFSSQGIVTEIVEDNMGEQEEDIKNTEETEKQESESSKEEQQDNNEIDKKEEQKVDSPVQSEQTETTENTTEIVSEDYKQSGDNKSVEGDLVPDKDAIQNDLNSLSNNAEQADEKQETVSNSPQGKCLIEGKWYFYNENGVMQKNTWVQDENGRYYAMPDGVLRTGWLSFGNTYYFCREDGAIVTGPYTVDGVCYYFDKNGIRLKAKKGWYEIGDKKYYAMPDGTFRTGWLSFGNTYYYCGSDGSLTYGKHKIDGKWYYFNKEGVREQSKWLELDGKKYYAMPDGAFQTGWLSFGNTYYYCGSDGSLTYGKQKIAGKWYYFGEDGIREQSKWLELNGKKYYAMPDGAFRTGWLSFGNTYYYCGSDGSLTYGKQKIAGKWYYFGEDGIREQSKWLELNGKKYYAMPDGAFRTGWLSFGNTYYYCGSDGSLTYGKQKIAGKWYYFDENGVREQSTWVELDGNRYYAMPDGAFRTGWLSFGNTYYYCGNDGAIITGKDYAVSGVLYTFDNNGVMQIKPGWGEYKENKYYINPSTGFPYTGWVSFGSTYYYANSNGIMVSGWQTIGGFKYYFYPDTKIMARNTTIDGIHIGSNGIAGKNGWIYENGYKFYYKDGIKQLDLDGILPKQSSYYIEVNRTTCTVTVYAKDGNNGYIIPVKRFACSVGLSSTPTPTGTFYTQNKYRWHTLIGPSYGQYCTRIVGGILFHSVAGYNTTSYNLKASDYNKLGSPASHGCVRLCVRDAKWIYDNCSLGTKVKIFDSSSPGPLGKPDTIKIPSWQNWDPTDPNI